MRGAGERHECPSSSSHARGAGKPCGLFAATACRSKRVSRWLRARSLAVLCLGPAPQELSETKPTCPCVSAQRAGDRISFTSKRTIASAPSELFVLVCGLGGELLLRAHSHTSASAAGRRIRR